MTASTTPDATIYEMFKQFRNEMNGKIDKLNELVVTEAARGLLRNQAVKEVRLTVESIDATLGLHRHMVENIEAGLALQGKKTLSVAEAARYAGVKPATVRKWLRLKVGKLKGTKTGTTKQARWRIAVSDLDRFLERMTNLPKSSVA